MANRRSLTRGGLLEATMLENTCQGHSVWAACAAASAPVRTFYNHHGRSPAFRHDSTPLTIDARVASHHAVDVEEAQRPAWVKPPGTAAKLTGMKLLIRPACRLWER